MGLKLEPVRFGDFLVDQGVIDEGQLLDALAEHWASGIRLGETVARKGWVRPSEVERLAREFENLHIVYV